MKIRTICCVCFWVAEVVLSWAFPGHLFSASLNLNAVQGKPGSTVNIKITLSNPEHHQIVSTEVEIGYDPAYFQPIQAMLGPSGVNAKKSIYTSDPLETPYTVMVLGFGTEVIPDGVVASVSFLIKDNTPPGSYILANTPSAAGAGIPPLPASISIFGYTIPVNGSDGEITVLSDGAVFTTTIPSVTTTVQGATTTASSTTTTTLLSSTTTAVQATSTTTATNGGGGRATTTISDTDTTTIPSPPPWDCVFDEDCDDGQFCNGTEQCINGFCAAGQVPCVDWQECRENIDQCWDRIRIIAAASQKLLMRPGINQEKCMWVMIDTLGENHFNPERSVIEFIGVRPGYEGVYIDSTRTAYSIGTFIFIPVCLKQDASAGQWSISITTETEDITMQENILAGFQVR